MNRAQASAMNNAVGNANERHLQVRSIHEYFPISHFPFPYSRIVSAIYVAWRLIK